jgi:hypothetical protein
VPDRARLAVFAVFCSKLSAIDNPLPAEILGSATQRTARRWLFCRCFRNKEQNRGDRAAGAADFSTSLGKISRMSERVAQATFFVNIIITALF